MDTHTSVLVARVKEGLDGFKAGVTNFLTEELVQDKPTGLTPARADRPFPRYLAATSPHQRINPQGSLRPGRTGPSRDISQLQARIKGFWRGYVNRPIPSSWPGGCLWTTTTMTTA